MHRAWHSTSSGAATIATHASSPMRIIFDTWPTFGKSPCTKEGRAVHAHVLMTNHSHLLATSRGTAGRLLPSLHGTQSTASRHGGRSRPPGRAITATPGVRAIDWLPIPSSYLSLPRTRSNAGSATALSRWQPSAPTNWARSASMWNNSMPSAQTAPGPPSKPSRDDRSDQGRPASRGHQGHDREGSL